MRTFKNQAAQGDVFITKVLELPVGCKKQVAQNGAHIITHSETGHHHVIKASPSVNFYNTENPLVSYIEVIKAADETEVVLEHLRSFHTHEALSFHKGIYRVNRQIEYTPQGWRKVQD